MAREKPLVCVFRDVEKSRVKTAPRHVLTIMPSVATLHVPAPEAALTWVTSIMQDEGMLLPLCGRFFADVFGGPGLYCVHRPNRL